MAYTQTNTFLVCYRSFQFSFIFYIYKNYFLKEILSVCLGAVNDYHWGFKPVLIKVNITLSEHFTWEEIENEMHLLFLLRTWTKIIEKMQEQFYNVI